MTTKGTGRACAACGTTTPWPSRSPVCQDCRDTLREAGTCVRCRDNPALTGDARGICRACKSDRVAKKKKVAARRATSQCLRCGEPTGGPSYCPEHRAPNLETTRTWRKSRMALGYCASCLREPAVAGMSACQPCRDRAQDRYNRLRKQALAGYGTACACCGETDPVVLDVDHVAPNWVGGRPPSEVGQAVFLRVIRMGFPAEFQVLCRNCNWSKRLHGICRLSHTETPAAYMYPDNPVTRSLQRLRVEVLMAYGGRCAHCDLADLDVLDLDHEAGGGAEDRRANHHAGIWRRLRNDGFPPGYRVLCRCCNWRAYREQCATVPDAA